MEANVVATPENAEIKDLSDVKRKMKFTGKIVKITLAGALVDIGLEMPGVVHISQLQKEPVNRVEDVVEVGQTVDVWVRRVEPKRDRLELTMIEPLPLEWREIEKGMVVKGKITRIEKFGVFVEIGAERPGLVHISEITHEYIKDPKQVVQEGDEVEVKVLDVNRRKKQIKLSMKALEEKPVFEEKPVIKKKKQPKISEPVEQEEVIPTAMELALREAMEKNQSDVVESSVETKNKTSSSDPELDQILARTLEHKVKTGSK
ncbi:MAG: S1 RNA-binding domain-containing protein [Anaerolineales bacterium]